MGLYANIDLSSLESSANNLIDEISLLLSEIFESNMEEASNTAQEEEGIEKSPHWDEMETIQCDCSSLGSETAEAFASAFLETAHSLCPIRTGYLNSTIGCNTGGSQVECYADAEYAQYVEYGTYKMKAQPYFEPAIEAGITSAKNAAQGEIDNLADQLIKIGEGVISEACDGVDAGSSIIVFIMVLLIMMILYTILYALIDVFISGMRDALEEAMNDIVIEIT